MLSLILLETVVVVIVWLLIYNCLYNKCVSPLYIML